MGLKETFVPAAQTVFTAFANVPISCTYTSTGKKKTNTHSGKVTSSDTSYTGVSVVFVGYQKSEIDDEHILSSDVKGLIPFENLTPTPKKNDKITDANGEVWGVKDWGTDPAEALWQLQLNKVG